MITKDVALVCMSRKRAKSYPLQSQRVFPTATLCVAESERDDYRGLSKTLLLHPDAVSGVGPVRQWILDYVKSHAVIMIPDDVTTCYGLAAGTYATRHTDPETIWALLVNTVECAEAAGAHLCGFNQAWDVRKFTPLQPFGLNGWVDGPMGIIGRELRYDDRLKLHPDIDFCLQQLMKYRLIWQDKRFAFAHDRWKQGGGNAVSRSLSAHETEFAYLRAKWGAHLEVRWAKGTFLSKMHVERRQSGVDD